RRWFYARQRDAWFLPDDMRAVRWDRDAHAAFAPHPAWAASRAAVRERPAASGTWTTFVFASRPTAGMFAQPASRVTRDGSIAIIDLSADEHPGRRALAVLTSAAADDDVIRVAASLDEADIEHLWLSHPLDWTRGRSQLAWAPAGRNARGRGGVVIDDVGLYRAEQFAQLFARGDPRVAAAAVRARMAARVGRLRG